MRIGIANDTGLAREALRRVVLSSPANEVAWMAKDGAEAVALARADVPDLILMDLFMPGTDGVEATRRIMGESPCAILVVTATITGHLSKVYQAMGYGALDAIDTPTLGPRGEISGAALLLHKIELIGKLLGKPAESWLNGPISAAADSSSLTWTSLVEKALDPLVAPGSLDRRSAGAGGGALATSCHARGRCHHHPACRRGICSGSRPVALRASKPPRACWPRKDIGPPWAKSCSPGPTTIWSSARIAACIILSSPGRALIARRSMFSSTVRLGTGRGPVLPFS